MSRAPATDEVIAAVDLGSNSFHMVVARYSHGQLVIVDRLREMVRLAAGISDDGRLDKEAAARFFARIFGLRFEAPSGHFAPVQVNATLTLLFDQEVDFESHHYAFHVDEAEFDAILGRVRVAISLTHI